MFFAFKCGKTGFFVAKNGKIQEISHSNAVQVSPLGPSKNRSMKSFGLILRFFFFLASRTVSRPFIWMPYSSASVCPERFFLALEGFFTFSQMKID